MVMKAVRRRPLTAGGGVCGSKVTKRLTGLIWASQLAV